MTNNQHLEGPTQRTRRENREEDTSTEDKDKGQGQEESDRGLPTKRTRVEHKGSHEFAKVS